MLGKLLEGKVTRAHRPRAGEGAQVVEHLPSKLQVCQYLQNQQLALHSHWFCIYKFNQPQIDNILKIEEEERG
jgi:hypothetical protein